MTEPAESGIPVTVTYRVLRLPRQPYYRWLKHPVTDAELVEAYRANALFDAHRDNPEFGHRLLADEAAQAGEVMSDRTAWRITSENGWGSAFGKKRGRNGKKPGPPVHDDLCTVTDDDGRVRHEFTADGPNQLWLTDITEHRTAERGTLPLRDQRRVRQQDRRVLHRFPDAHQSRRASTRERCRDAG